MHFRRPRYPNIRPLKAAVSEAVVCEVLGRVSLTAICRSMFCVNGQKPFTQHAFMSYSTKAGAASAHRLYISYTAKSNSPAHSLYYLHV